MNNLASILPGKPKAAKVKSILLLGVFKKNSSIIVHYCALASLLITGVLIYNESLNQNIMLFNDSYVVDKLSSYMKILTIIATAFVLSISTRYLKIFKSRL